jgi:hypothetical protein
MWPLVIVDSKSSKQINMMAHCHILIILFRVIMLDYNRQVSIYFLIFLYSFDIQRTLLEENGTSCWLLNVKLKNTDMFLEP